MHETLKPNTWTRLKYSNLGRSLRVLSIENGQVEGFEFYLSYTMIE
jgi:hypothetical protein